MDGNNLGILLTYNVSCPWWTKIAKIYRRNWEELLKGQYHAIFSNTLKIERRYSVDSSQDIMTKIPLKYYQNAKKLSTDVFAGR